MKIFRYIFLFIGILLLLPIIAGIAYFGISFMNGTTNKNVSMNENETKYKVTLYDNFSEMIRIDEVKEGEAYSFPSCELEGRRLIDWYTDSTYKTSYDFTTKVYADFDLYAKVIPNIYTVTFFTNTTSGTIKEDVQYGFTSPDPGNFKKYGYVFEGWYTSSGEYFDLSSPIKKNITLYAKWAIPSDPVITFVTNTDTSIPQKIVAYDGIIEEPNGLSKSGYYLYGWYSDSNFTQKYIFGGHIKSDLTLYARWELDLEYKVTLNYSGKMATDYVYVKNQQLCKVGYPTYNEYIVNNWYTDSEKNNRFDINTTPITKDITLYAAWTINTNTYQVSFVNSIGNSIIETYNIKAGNTIDRPTSAKHYNDKVFIDYYQNGELYDFSTKIYSDTIITMKYEAGTPVYIRYMYSSKNKLLLEKQIHSGAKAIDNKPNFDENFEYYTRLGLNGKIVSGWYTDSTFKNEFNMNSYVTSDITLYGKFEADTEAKYTVSFNTNGGNSINALTVTSGNKINTILSNKNYIPRKDGYVFTKWYTDSSLKNEFNTSSAIQKNLTLYAGYTVCAKPNGITIFKINKVSSYSESNSIYLEIIIQNNTGVAIHGFTIEQLQLNHLNTVIKGDFTVSIANGNQYTLIIKIVKSEAGVSDIKWDEDIQELKSHSSDSASTLTSRYSVEIKNIFVF